MSSNLSSTASPSSSPSPWAAVTPLLDELRQLVRDGLDCSQRLQSIELPTMFTMCTTYTKGSMHAESQGCAA